MTDENGKYNYAKAVHPYPPFFDISCSAKNYKIASALTSGLTFENRPGLREFHTETVDGGVDILLLCDLARLGRDLDRNLQYWYLLRDLDVSIHTVNSGEVDLNVAAMLRKILEQ